MDRLIDAYCRLLVLLGVGMLAIMVVLVFGNVVLRYGFNASIVVSEELSRWLFVWLTFLGAIVALRERAHLGTDLLLRHLPRPARMACLLLSQAVMAYVSWLLLSGAIEQARLNMDVAAPVSQLPVALFYASGIVFGVSALLLLAREAWRLLAGRISDEELVLVRESEDEPHATAAAQGTVR